MKKVLIILEDGVEDSEGLATRALLRRAAVAVSTVTSNLNKIVRTGYGLNVFVDYHFSEINPDDYQLLIIPGGPYINRIYDEDTIIHQYARDFYQKKKPIAAICSAPQLIGALGFLDGLEFTCYPGNEVGVEGGIYRPDRRIINNDNLIITARSSGYVIEFAYEIVRVLYGREKAEALINHLAWQNHL